MNNEIPKLQGTSSFSISRYIVNCVLPKCSMVHGEFIPSTYFQIALTINNNQQAKSWQKNRSWIGVKTISKITKFNPRTINKAIKILEEVELISVCMHGKLKMFKLRNNNIYRVSELVDFNHEVENKLLNSINEEDREKVKDRFRLLDRKLKMYDIESAKKLLKKYWIEDICNFREKMIFAESIYKGSSLFYINLINVQDVFKKETLKTEYISEKDWGLTIGCSQSTLSRYMNAYRSANIVADKSCNIDKINKLENEEIKGVVNSTMEKSGFVCPICGKIAETIRSFNLHLSKVNDMQHQTLNKLRKEKRTPDYEVTMMLYEQHKEMLDSFGSETSKQPLQEDKKIVESKQVNTTNYMDVPCECKISCNECFKDWKCDFFDNCERPRKKAYVEEYGLNQQGKTKKTIVVNDYKNIPSIKKGPSEDTAPGLLKYFYDLNNKKSPNWAKECKQIKNLLIRKEQPLSADEVRIVLKYMVRKGHMDVRFLGSSVSEALMENQLLKEVDNKDTVSYLVKKFYNGHGMGINLQTFVKDVQRVQETINSGLSFEETEIVIDYMVKTGCMILNFIGSKRNDALSSYSKVKSVDQKQAINNFDNNPSFFDQDYMNIINDELISGRTSLKKVDQKYYRDATELARKIFKDKKYVGRFTAFEWLWRVGLQLDNELYSIACSELNKTTYIESVINSGRLREDQMQSYLKLKVKFEKWLQQQHDLFEDGRMINS